MMAKKMSFCMPSKINPSLAIRMPNHTIRVKTITKVITRGDKLLEYRKKVKKNKRVIDLIKLLFFDVSNRSSDHNSARKKKMAIE